VFTTPVRRSSLWLITASLSITPAVAVAQTTWYVDITACPNSGTGTELDPFCKIQNGINRSADGDTVLVLDGTYSGDGNRDIDFEGRLITLRSENGPGTCIINCQGSESDPHRGIWFHSSETGEAKVEGFTITGGFTPGPGGGMYVFDGCDPTITNCRFAYNSAGKGGGMYVARGSNPVVSGCEFIGNNASDDGGGLYNLDGSNPAVIGCLFSGNTAVDDGGGMYNWFHSSPVVLNSVFVGNYAGEGGAIYNKQRGSPVLVNCVITGNSAMYAGAMQTGEGYPTLTNCIVWDNGGEQIRDFGGTTTVVSSSDVAGGWNGDGNIVGDPLFVRRPDSGGDGWGDLPDTPDVDEGANDDYGDLRLQDGSPCIDAGDNEAIAGFKTDLDDNPRIVNDIVDMGAYEFQGTRPIEVRIDVCPGNDVNPVKLGSRGVLPIAILSSDSFDALTVDPSTVLMAGAGVALRSNGRRYVTIERDVNHDDLVDLVVHVETAGVETEADTFKLALTAQTYDGTLIFGTDTVRTVGR